MFYNVCVINTQTKPLLLTAWNSLQILAHLLILIRVPPHMLIARTYYFRQNYISFYIDLQTTNQSKNAN